jgi:FKBP-type peptidyl-prolyl cis-trans isomerase
MSRFSGWLAVATVLALSGCQQGQGGAPSAASGSSTNSSSGTTTTSTTTTTQGTATPETAGPKEIAMSNGLKYVDLKVGDGTIAESGSSVTVHYTGWLTDGTKFDSSVDSGKPFTFRIDAGQVIAGWDQGVKGMRVGGKRKLTIPPDLGYGARGAGGVIPPNATLVFDVELLEVH